MQIGCSLALMTGSMECRGVETNTYLTHSANGGSSGMKGGLHGRPATAGRDWSGNTAACEFACTTHMWVVFAGPGILAVWASPSPPSINEQWHAHDTKHDLQQLYFRPSQGEEWGTRRAHGLAYTLLPRTVRSKKSLPWADNMKAKYFCPWQTF